MEVRRSFFRVGRGGRHILEVRLLIRFEFVVVMPHSFHEHSQRKNVAILGDGKRYRVALRFELLGGYGAGTAIGRSSRLSTGMFGFVGHGDFFM